MDKRTSQYLLRLGDNALILGHRLSEWCGHGPVLEQDIAITNIALDLLGQARNWLSYAAQLAGEGRTEDDLAYLRDVLDFRNVLLVEQPNQDWAYTITRQFFFDVFNELLHRALVSSTDAQIVAIAKKSSKEIAYHLRYSSEWMIRLGDGTTESHEKMQRAVDDLWMYTGELLTPDAEDRHFASLGIGVDLEALQASYQAKVADILTRATLQQPTDEWMQHGGKQGRHTEHLGYLLAEMQFLQRAYPGQQW